MQIGMIGLGRMGAHMVRRLARGGHECVAFDQSEKAVQALAADGAKGAHSLAAFAGALRAPQLEHFAGRVSDSGEGRWTVQAAIEEGVPSHVLSAAPYSRFDSRGNTEFASKVLSAMRLGFGGHHESKS